jgi:hypothetical protein
MLLSVGLACLAGSLAAADRGGFSLSVIVDGAAVPEYAARGRVYVEALKGKEFVLRISNPTSERIAAALSVDGRNVVDAKRTSALDATKWVLGPGQTIDVPGWQVSGATSRKFFFTETAKSYAKWLGDTSNVGTIEAVFYREKRRHPGIARKDHGEPMREAGASGRDEAQSAAPESPAPSAKSQARSADGFAATGIGEETGFPVDWVAFEQERSSAARIALRYEFRAELVRLGVLPREEELFARDRAHGFEHDYAPDPFRR